MTDLAATLDDLVWEQALESALRRRLVTVADLKHPVLDRRPAGAPPTESLLETSFVQARPILPDAVRQLWIEDAHARLDLAWPQVGLFVELDGQHHKDQPVYDARRDGSGGGDRLVVRAVHVDRGRPDPDDDRPAAGRDQLARSSSATR